MNNTKKLTHDLYDLGYFKVNKLGELTYVSQEFCRAFSVKAEKLLGSSASLLCSIDPIKKVIQNGNPEYSIVLVIQEKTCIAHILPLEEEGAEKSALCQVILRADDISSESLLAFLHSKNYRKKIQPAYSNSYRFDQIIGSSRAMAKVLELAAKIAKSNSTILLTGESGTGKELFAQGIHDISQRRNGPFVPINCAAIPPELFESELFGYEGGAFSGARREGKAGKIELAQQGTLFLDEISELPFPMQGKLLRVLQEREVERVGGSGIKSVDIRVIAATNRDLKQLVKEGKFRQDLYYRIHIFELKLPPLRERKEDILPITYEFIRRFNDKLGLNVISIDPDLQEWLVQYQWPGNVRELQHSVERAMHVAEGSNLTSEAFHMFTDYSDAGELNDEKDIHRKSEYPGSESNENSVGKIQKEVHRAEAEAIRKALEKANGDKMLAAQILDIHIASLYRKLSKYNLK
ncbi:AAA family ATPase [Brevibacillus fluminis]|uniref:AAA family ATPase n=1 Tax=Brevibacillus fluminis TaxID=511487 RepID=A0A3M8DJT0_9BACL|nr:sigma 54-interacting transcriptional regulator [Brevibacillus fluminis]RNB87645.1 AAA family ATPase [Brevibacillus fluminis]